MISNQIQFSKVKEQYENDFKNDNIEIHSSNFEENNTNQKYSPNESQNNNKKANEEPNLKIFKENNEIELDNENFNDKNYLNQIKSILGESIK